MPRLALLPIALLLAFGCSGDDGSLTGSLGDVYRLDHSQVRARLYTSELSIEYVARDGSVPVRVTLRLDEVEIAERSYDLLQFGDITGRAADGNEIPRFEKGSMDLERFAPRNGESVVGSFDANFDTGRDTVSLSGEFDTSLEVISWPPRPDPQVQSPDAGDS